MEVDFAKKALIDLYEKGYSKKFRFVDKNLVRKFLERINRIEAAQTIDDLRIPPSMRFERLEGTENSFSIRLNDQIRLHFDIDFEDGERTTGKVMITNITTHYE